MIKIQKHKFLNGRENGYKQESVSAEECLSINKTVIQVTRRGKDDPLE